MLCTIAPVAWQPQHSRLPTTTGNSCSAPPSALLALSIPGASSTEPTDALADFPLLTAVNEFLILVFVFLKLHSKITFGLPFVVLHSTC